MQLLDFQTQVRPDALAADGATHHGSVELSQLPRFASAVESSLPLEAHLAYEQDEDGVFIDTTLNTRCQLLCQFCLSQFSFLLQTNNRFRPVFTLEAAREVSAECEPVLYEDGIINIINMIEDEALLALPNYPQCNDCKHHKADTLSSHFDIIPDDQALGEPSWR